MSALLTRATDALASAGVHDPGRDARRLFEFAYEIGDRSGAPQQRDHPNAVTLARFEAALAARVARKPVSQIIGRRAFWTHEFEVTPDVLDPRPDTETLIEIALMHPFQRVLDLGTGSGCILISLLAERPEARGVGTDISDRAVLVAGRNAARIGVVDRALFPLSDWFEDVGGTYDLIVSNPPYIAEDEMADLAPEVRDHEPHTALTDGGDGLNAYRIIARDAPRCLAPKGRLLLEIGWKQSVDITRILLQNGWGNLRVWPDLAGHDRVIEAYRG